MRRSALASRGRCASLALRPACSCSSSRSSCSSAAPAAPARALRGLGVHGFAGGMGVGWLAACLLLSGSPVAAMALTLLAAGTLNTAETFGMIAGSRLGASFVVLVIGALDDLRAGRQETRSAYIGIAALVTTAVVYLPGMTLAWLALSHGALSGLRVEGRDARRPRPAGLRAPAAAAGAAARRCCSSRPASLVLLAAFKAFDRALPDLESRGAPLLPADHVVYRPWFMFGVGLLTTALTLSVSMSISLLVPLAARGYVRRENVWPYILGANVTTLIDTLFAGALVGHPDAARMVALLMGTVALLSLPPVFAFPYAFGSGIDRVARLATAQPPSLLLFVAASSRSRWPSCFSG